MTPTQIVATNERQSCILPDGFKVIDAAIARQLALDFEETGKALNAMAKRCEVLQELNDTLRRRNITLMDQRDELQESIEQEKRNRAAACATLTKDCNLYAKRTHQLLMGILNLRTEINCRIEHGADSGGHLEYVQSALDSIKMCRIAPG